MAENHSKSLNTEWLKSGMVETLPKFLNTEWQKLKWNSKTQNDRKSHEILNMQWWNITQNPKTQNKGIILSYGKEKYKAQYFPLVHYRGGVGESKTKL